MGVGLLPFSGKATADPCGRGVIVSYSCFARVWAPRFGSRSENCNPTGFCCRKRFYGSNGRQTGVTVPVPLSRTREISPTAPSSAADNVSLKGYVFRGASVVAIIV